MLVIDVELLKLLFKEVPGRNHIWVQYQLLVKDGGPTHFTSLYRAVISHILLHIKKAHIQSFVLGTHSHDGLLN